MHDERLAVSHERNGRTFGDLTALKASGPRRQKRRLPRRQAAATHAGLQFEREPFFDGARGREQLAVRRVPGAGESAGQTCRAHLDIALQHQHALVHEAPSLAAGLDREVLTLDLPRKWQDANHSL